MLDGKKIIAYEATKSLQWDCMIQWQSNIALNTTQ